MFFADRRRLGRSSRWFYHAARSGCHLRQSEVENLGVPSVGDEDVCGFDVTMDYAFRMSRVQGICDLDAQIEHGFDLIRPFNAVDRRNTCHLCQYPSRRETGPLNDVQNRQPVTSVFNFKSRTGVPMAASSTRVLVVDDFEPYRRFLCSRLQKRPELQVIGEVSDGLEAVQRAQELHPDLILLDISLPVLSGIEAARRILEISPPSKILFVTENRSTEMARNVLSMGACGYLVKSDSASELLPAVEAVLQGKLYVSASLQMQAVRPTDLHPAAR